MLSTLPQYILTYSKADMAMPILIMFLHLVVHFTTLHKASSQRSGNTCHRSLWPGGLVEYEMDITFESYTNFMPRFFNVTMLIGQKTCVRFVKTRGVRNDIVLIMRLAKPFGERGRQNVLHNGHFNYTLISLREDSEERTILHELMHSIGIADEQSREDRDNYVEIYYAQVMKGMEYSFNKENFPPKPSAYPPYSLRTAMHYPLEAYSNNSRMNVLRIKNAKLSSSPSDHYVAYDIDRISGLYFHLYKCQNVEACKHLTCVQSNYVFNSPNCK